MTIVFDHMTISRASIGTSGWNYDHWRGVFYPRGLPADEWLEFYARHFDTVEINFSFYKLPERENFEKWAAETPDDFTFAVKASRYLTHQKKLKDPEEPVERLFSHARGLGDKMSVVLYQLPPRWKVNVERLSHFLNVLPRDVRHAMEFRDPSWYTDQVYDLLRKHSVALCIMSAPDLPRIFEITAPFTYIRMHNGGYDTEGNYEDPQLEWWADQVRSFLDHGDVYVYFNNDYKGFAIRNATRLIEMIRDP